MPTLRALVLLYLTLFSGCAQHSPTIHEQLDAGLLGHWTMDYVTDTDACLISDIGPLNLTGKCIGNVRFVEDRYGNPGKALYFNGGLDDYVRIPHDRRFERITTRMTIAMWVYNERNSITFNPNVNHNTVDGSFLISKGRDLADGSWFMATRALIMQQPTPIGVNPRFKNGNGFKPTTELPMNKWIFLIGVVNGSYGKIYMNGNVWYSGDNHYDRTYSGENNLDPIILGQHHNKPENWDKHWVYSFRGKMDDVRIWNRALTNLEIQQLYQAERPKAWQEWIQTDIFRWGMLVLSYIAVLSIGIWGGSRLQKRTKVSAVALPSEATTSGQTVVELIPNLIQPAVLPVLETAKAAHAPLLERTTDVKEEIIQNNTQNTQNTRPPLTDFLQNFPSSSTWTPEDREYAEQILQAIHDHAQKPLFSVDFMAHELKVSRRKLERDTRRLFGSTPTALVKRVMEEGSDTAKGLSLSVSKQQ